MAKKNKVQRIKIYSKIFTGYSDEMPEDSKVELLSENPKLHKSIFGEIKPAIEPIIE